MSPEQSHEKIYVFLGPPKKNMVIYHIETSKDVGIGAHGIPWKSKTKQRMVFRMIHIKDSLLPMGKVWSLDFLGIWYNVNTSPLHDARKLHLPPRALSSKRPADSPAVLGNFCWGTFLRVVFQKNNKKLDFSWSQLQSCKKNTQKCEHLRFFSPSKVSKLRNFCHSFTGSCVCWRPLWDSSILRKDSTSRFNSPSSSSFSMTTCHRKFWAQIPQCLAMTTVVIFSSSILFPLHLFVPRYALMLKSNGSNIRFTYTKFAQIMSPWNITRISHLKPFKVMFTSHPKRDIHRKSCSMITMKMMINSMVKSFNKKKTTNIFAVSTISKVIQVGPYLFPTHIHGKDEINHHITSASSNFVASRSCAKRASCRATLSNWSCLTVARSRGRWGFVEVQWGQKPCYWFI